MDKLRTMAAREYLPENWKILKGKGIHAGMIVYVNPEGKPCVLELQPLEGTDFFTTAQEAVVYVLTCAFKRYALELNMEKLKETLAQAESYTNDQKSVLPAGPLPVDAPPANALNSAAERNHATKAPVRVPIATIDLRSPPKQHRQQQQLPFHALPVVSPDAVPVPAASGKAAMHRAAANVTYNTANVSAEGLHNEGGDSSGDLESVASTDSSHV
jgi:hypothetical protein